MNVRFLVVVAACSGALIFACDKGDSSAAAAASASAAAAASAAAPAVSAATAMTAGGEMGHHEDHAMATGDSGAPAGTGMMRGPGGDHGDHGGHERH